MLLNFVDNITLRSKTMKTIVYKANSRGIADHGWLKSAHTFSFASYHNPARMHFGALRVLNDDYVAAANGFGKHGHDNMEIISIPLEGSLKHQDSMGNDGIIRPGEIQVMSAGTGIQHSEFNASDDEAVKFLQIWLFPNKRDVTPRYDQQTIDPLASINKFQQILSPNADDAGVWIHQDAWFHMADMEMDLTLTYELKNPNNGVFVFVLEGELLVGDEALDRRDAIGLWESSHIDMTAKTSARVLLMEVPIEI